MTPEQMLAEILNPRVGSDLESIAREFGATRREQNPNLARLLAGTDDRRSREYRAALRRVQRYRAGPGQERRRPAPEVRTRLQRTARRLATTRRRRELASRPSWVEVSGEIEVSRDRRRRTVSLTGSPMSPDAMADVVQAWDSGDRATAVDSFQEAFADHYGVPGLSIHEVDGWKFGFGS